MTLHVYTDDCDYFAAESVEDTEKVYEEWTGQPRDDSDGSKYELYPDDHKLTISCEADDYDSTLHPPDAEVVRDDGFVRVTATAQDWCAHCGRGFLCSTEW